MLILRFMIPKVSCIAWFTTGHQLRIPIEHPDDYLQCLLAPIDNQRKSIDQVEDDQQCQLTGEEVIEW